MGERFCAGYKIGPTLGSGVQGKVKLGITKEGSKVALKFIDANKIAMFPSEKANLEREIKALQTLGGHPNVVCIKEYVGPVDYPKTRKREPVPRILVVLELAESGELFDYLMYTGRFPEKVARTYFRQLIDAMRHCKKAGISHRDLKPENLLVDKSFALKVADLGLSSSAVDSEGKIKELYTKVGTPGYMAPEVLAGLPYDGFKADIWSAGVILFIMIGGFPPFHAARDADWWFDKVKRKNYQLFWQAHLRSAPFSQGAMKLLNKIFVANPSERATLEDLMEDEWVKGEIESPALLESEMRRRWMEVSKQKAASKKQKQAAEGDVDMDSIDPFDASAVRRGALDPYLKMLDFDETAPMLDDVMPLHIQVEGKDRHVGARVAEALASLGAPIDAESCKEYRFKTTVPTSDGPMGIVARVGRQKDSDKVVVDFKRRSGGGFEAFRKIYGAIEQKLAAPLVEESGGGGGGDEDITVSDDVILP